MHRVLSVIFIILWSINENATAQDLINGCTLFDIKYFESTTAEFHGILNRAQFDEDTSEEFEQFVEAHYAENLHFLSKGDWGDTMGHEFNTRDEFLNYLTTKYINNGQGNTWFGGFTGYAMCDENTARYIYTVTDWIRNHSDPNTVIIGQKWEEDSYSKITNGEGIFDEHQWKIVDIGAAAGQYNTLQSNTKPMEQKPMEQKPMEQKPMEQKPMEQNTVEQKPMELKTNNYKAISVFDEDNNIDENEYDTKYERGEYEYYNYGGNDVPFDEKKGGKSEMKNRLIELYEDLHKKYSDKYSKNN